jgi:asparagine synthase (glutamine-hydrolysing)
MCGIVGMLVRDHAASHWRAPVQRAMQQMVRRGPDSAGLWSDQESCTLGFRRLAILDLSSAGEQPMLTADGRHALVFNGELYNFREIRASLQSRGIDFRSTGDAEVVLQALALHGVDALASFNGMFALAFYDVSQRRLLLARDHAGIKPLYVLQHAEGIFFASQFDQVLAHPWASGLPLDETAVRVYMNIGYLPAPMTMLGNARSLEAGSWLSLEASGRSTSGRWFSLPPYREPEFRGREAIEAVGAAVTAAVRRQLVSDVPVGVLLSGGIDSPLVAAEARGAHELPAFTIGTGGDEHDESAEASRYAAALGLSHFVRQVDPGTVVELLDDVVSASGEPTDDYSMFPMMMVSRLAREHVKVVLSGDGGDDLFWGYPGRMIEPLRGPEATRRGVVDFARRVLGRGAPPAPRHDGARQLRVHRFIDPRLLASVLPTLSLDLHHPLFAFAGGDTDHLAQWLRWNEYSGHLAKVLQKVDRASMHCSLEVRVPLLDREVVDVASRVDWRACVDRRGLVGKLPLRAALRRHVPFQAIAKRGFTVPMSSWLRGPLRPMVDDLVLSRHDLLGLPIDRTALAAHVGRERAGTVQPPWLTWRLLSLALWEARHRVPEVAHA